MADPNIIAGVLSIAYSGELAHGGTDGVNTTSRVSGTIIVKNASTKIKGTLKLTLRRYWEIGRGINYVKHGDNTTTLSWVFNNSTQPNQSAVSYSGSTDGLYDTTGDNPQSASFRLSIIDASWTY